MFTLHLTYEDLGSLGLPMPIRRDMQIAYYYWIKEGKPILEFTFDRVVTEEEYNTFMENTKWLKK